jgi:pimeloyl-ACP methyl ester carboxylesterase
VAAPNRANVLVERLAGPPELGGDAYAVPDIRPPSALLALSELPRVLMELGALPLALPALAGAPRGDGQPVLVVPGFIANDVSTALLRRYLAGLGYDVHGWQLGRNLGPRSVGPDGDKLMSRLAAVHAMTGQRLSLVGWSLGGVMARLLARRAPDMVRQVIMLGSPFAASPRATNVWRLYQLLTGHRLDGPDALAHLAEVAAPLSVPSTAIYSRADGMVAWQACRERGPGTENIEVAGSHLGLANNPAVLYAVADRLSQPPASHRPFVPPKLRRLEYPHSR